MTPDRKKSTVEVIKRLLNGEDYRIIIQNDINLKFLNYCIDFFKEIINAKVKNKDITMDWYKNHFIDNEKIKSDDIAIYAGINKKTITNIFNSGKKEVIISASKDNYYALTNSIKLLISKKGDLEMNLTIKFNEDRVELNLNESLLVFSSLAVKRSAIRGGSYSSIGKNVEKPLMQTLCKLFGVSDSYYDLNIPDDGKSSYGKIERQVDFYLKNENEQYKCELKLMGKGNPESADVIYAREADIFIADKLSETNKKQLNFENIHWVELRDDSRFDRFEKILKDCRIPYNKRHFNEELSYEIEEILKDLLE